MLFLILYYIAYWKLFIKMNYSGWECLIPIYNEYLLCKKININKIFIIIYLVIKSIVIFLFIIYFLFLIFFLIAAIFIQLFVLGGFFTNIIWSYFLVGIIILGILFTIYSIMRTYIIYKTSLMFGKNNMTSIIFGIFNYIGVVILGFDESSYEG